MDSFNCCCCLERIMPVHSVVAHPCEHATHLRCEFANWSMGPPGPHSCPMCRTVWSGEFTR
eukprot:1012896-Pyramimonas_sp.AAC.1